MDDLLIAFLHLLNDTAALLRRGRREHLGLADFLDEFRVKRVNPLFRRCRSLGKSHYTICLVGLTNVGKSTVAHALLEHPVAPRRNSPATSLPIVYEYGQRWALTLHSTATQSVVTTPYPSVAGLSSDLSRYAFDAKAVADGRISRLIVTGPMDLLSGGVVFADTPGFGSARPGASLNQDVTALVSYISENVDEVLFCVSGASYSLLPEEKSFFDSFRDLCSTVVVTKALADESEDLNAALMRYRATFQHIFPLCDFMFVEAKWAIGGDDVSRVANYEASRVALLRDFIKDRSSSLNRLASLRQQTADAWDDLLVLAGAHLRDAGLGRIPWRPDSWASFKRHVESVLADHLEQT